MACPAKGGQERPGDVELESFVSGLVDLQHGDGDDHDADGHVDEERQPPRDDGQRPAEHQAEYGAHALHGG